MQTKPHNRMTVPTIACDNTNKNKASTRPLSRIPSQKCDIPLHNRFQTLIVEELPSETEHIVQACEMDILGCGSKRVPNVEHRVHASNTVINNHKPGTRVCTRGTCNKYGTDKWQ